MRKRSHSEDDGVSDEALLAGMALGDERAGLTFVRHYQYQLFGLAFGMIGDVGFAEDIAQEAFVRIFRHATIFDARRGSVSTWALTITRNLSIDALRTLLDLAVEQRRAVVLAAMYGRTAGAAAHTDRARNRQEPYTHRDGYAPTSAHQYGGSVSDYSVDPRQCEAIAEEPSELALGILSARRRSEVLNHVESCRRCNAELEVLAFVGDAILQLAPESEPPLGFEQRLAERLQANTIERRPTRLRRTCVLSAVAMLLLVLGFGLGDITRPRNGNGHSQSTTSNLTSVRLTSRGQVLGEIFVSQGKPKWIFMAVDNGARSGAVTCAVTLVGGRVETIGKFHLSPGYGAWRAPLKSFAAHVRAAELVAPDGAVLASARFPA